MESGGYREGNRLLDAVPGDERAEIVRSLLVVSLAAGDVVQQPGEEIAWVGFPIDTALSVMVTMEDGQTCEVGTIGREGATGVEVAFGTPVLRTTLCQVAGTMARMPAASFLDAIRHSPGLDGLVRATERARTFFIEQLSACNALHSLPQRFARWMLMLSDCANRESYALTHEHASILLGVRRATVTNAAGELQRLGALEYRRGHVTIVDRSLLESVACNCYAETKAVFDEALHVWAGRAASAVPNAR
jgi:CRP-like cAMP-binding protein